MRLLAKAPRQQNLLALAGRKIRHILFELHARKVKLAQDGFKQALIDAASFGKIGEIAL